MASILEEPVLHQEVKKSDEVDQSKLRDYLAPILMPHVKKSAFGINQTIQTYCGVRPVKVKKDGEQDDTIAEAWRDSNESVSFRIFNFFVSLIAHFGSFVGGEMFYITFFPFLFWNIDASLGRRVICNWVISMYFGQGLKDRLRLPRPAVLNSRIRPLEGVFLAEFGFPSTHVMSVFAQAATTLYYSWKYNYSGNPDYPLGTALLIATAIILATCFGRLYMGVHTLPDVIAGFFLGILVFMSVVSYEREIDDFITQSSATLFTPTLISLLALLVYPKPRQWTATFGDTAVVFGVGHGVLLGSYLAKQAGYDCVLLPWLEVDFGAWCALAFARAILGYIVLGAVRHVMKRVAIQLVLTVTPKSDVPLEQRYAIGVPSKFICYSCVGFAAVYIMPKTYELIGLTIDLIQ